MGDWREKLGEQWEYSSSIKKLINLEGRVYHRLKTFQLKDRRLKKKPDKISIDEKPLELNEEMWNENEMTKE